MKRRKANRRLDLYACHAPVSRARSLYCDTLLPRRRSIIYTLLRHRYAGSFDIPSIHIDWVHPKYSSITWEGVPLSNTVSFWMGSSIYLDSPCGIIEACRIVYGRVNTYSLILSASPFSLFGAYLKNLQTCPVYPAQIFSSAPVPKTSL